ncbi:unnamed protein product [Adineta steineri]|uniref:Uncharacterized protein n=1 Tax=Adineta steineri TaxID=433720 RepID=A0A815AP64_9BILA|nr:unnamed protein product [Adineta steineri]CAF4014569.1 unnamed protein product [Adineta steineri]
MIRIFHLFFTHPRKTIREHSYPQNDDEIILNVIGSPEQGDDNSILPQAFVSRTSFCALMLDGNRILDEGVQYLTEMRRYTFDKLSALISYTPSLRHLNLSHSNIRFLHADRWQKLLLEKFSLRYREPGYGDNYPIHDGELNNFVSPFWIQRNLIVDIEICEYDIYYFVRPFKKRWYEYSIEHSKLAQLTIKYFDPHDAPNILLNQIKRVLNFTQIYHLNIEQNISIARLINIKYVCLEKTCTMEDILFLISFCRHMEYLDIECIKNMNIQSFLSEILNKMNENHREYLHALCIYITTADNQMIKQLEQMIDDEKLLLDYTIHRQLYNIYLKWK